MERYAVLNVGSGEILSQWHTTEAAAHADAAECRQRKTQPDCKVVRFSEWAPRRRVAALRGERWEGAFAVIGSGPDWSFRLTGEIVSAQEAGYEVADCGRVMYKREG